MADITTKPTPIQRNPMDVATELTQLHIKKFGADYEDDIADLYAKYYSLAIVLKAKYPSDLYGFLLKSSKQN